MKAPAGVLTPAGAGVTAAPRLDRFVLGSVRDVRQGELLAHVVYRKEDGPRGAAAVTLTTFCFTPAGGRIDAADTELVLPASHP
jgi:hypothetical protein